MPTRFYLPNSGTSPVASPVLSAVWDITTGFFNRPTDVTKSNTALGAGTARQKGSTTAWHDRLDGVFISTQQLAAQTIAAGTFSAVIRAVESNAAADDFLQIVIKVVSADGATTRGTIYAGSALTAVSATASAENGEYPTTSATRIKSAIATTSVVAQAGDRIQIELGARTGGTTTTHTFTHRFGDPTATADFALTAGLTSDAPPWVELSQTLTWQSATRSGSSAGT